MPESAVASCIENVQPDVRDAELSPAPAAPRAGAFRANFAWTLAANVVYAACQWGMLAVLAKLCSAAEVGSFALGLALTAPVILFSNLQLRSVLATDARRRFAFAEYLHLRLWTTAAALAVVILLALVQTRNTQVRIAIVLLGLAKCVESLSDVLHGALQAEERMAVIARSLIFRGLLSLSVMAAAAFVWRSAVAAAGAWLAAFVIIVALYDWPAVQALRNVPVRITGARLRSLAVLALPLGIVQGLVSLSANIPRYALERSAGLAELGIFSALASLIVVGQTVVSALGNVASPRLAKMHAEGDTRGFARMLGRMITAGLLLGSIGTVISAVAGGPILTLLFRAEYGAQSSVLTVIMIGATAAYTAWFLGFGLTAAGLFREQIPLLAAVCATAWIAASALIPSYGAWGAAASFAVAMAIQAVGAASILFVASRRGIRV